MKKITNNKGITLIEVLISIAIISIIGISFFSTLNNTTIQNAKNEKNLKTMDVVQSEIELIIKDIKLGKSEIVLDDTETINLNNLKNQYSYNKVYGNNDNYSIKVYINKEQKNQQTRQYFLYNIKVIGKSNSDFSDREVTLETYVLERF